MPALPERKKSRFCDVVPGVVKRDSRELGFESDRFIMIAWLHISGIMQSSMWVWSLFKTPAHLLSLMIIVIVKVAIMWRKRSDAGVDDGFNNRLGEAPVGGSD
jgi:hypothetical protein